MRACAMLKRYQDQVTAQCNRSIDEIYNMLLEAGFCDDNVLRDRLGKFFKIVLTPYANLVTKIQCAPENYSWQWGYCSRTVKKHMLQSYDIIDSKTHSRVINDIFHALPDTAVIGDYILTVFPSLSRITEGQDQSNILIAKGSILVKFHDTDLPVKRARLSVDSSPDTQQFAFKAELDSSTHTQNLRKTPQ